MALNRLFGGFRHHAEVLQVQSQLAELQKRTQRNPDNLNLQIRIADLFIRLGKKDQAVQIYRQTAEKYAQQNLLRQAIALNKIVLRLGPPPMAVTKAPPVLCSQKRDEEGETDRSVGNKERDMVVKTILLINEEGEQLWLEEKHNGSLWKGDKEIFTSETEASTKGWRVDAVKIAFDPTDGKDKC